MSKEAHVLIVEDDDKLSRLYGKILKHVGFETVRVSSVEEALFQLKKFDPDVVCLDWQVGDQVSETVLAVIAAVEPQNTPKIILASGRILKSDLLTFTTFVNLIDVVLMKPVVLSDLVATVKKLAREAKTDRKPVQMIEVNSLENGAIQLVWEGRLSEVMVESMQKPEVLAAKTIILDMRATYLDNEFTPQISSQLEKWTNLKDLYLVHEETEIGQVRGLVSPLLSKAACHFFTTRDKAVAAATQPKAEPERVPAESNGKPTSNP